MDLPDHSDKQVQSDVIVTQHSELVLEVNQLSDIVLQRLMEEVKNDKVNSIFAYDRAHNRHNRGR